MNKNTVRKVGWLEALGPHQAIFGFTDDLVNSINIRKFISVGEYLALKEIRFGVGNVILYVEQNSGISFGVSHFEITNP
jgi:hypothetical protein